MSDLQVGLVLWPGFGQKPDASPEASSEQQSPEPVDAVAEHAYGARRSAARLQVIGGQRLWRRAQVAWSDATIMGVFHPGAVGQGQQGGYRQHQPVAGDACRVGASCLVPFPAHALDGLEAQLYPEAQGVNGGVIMYQVGGSTA